MRSEWWKPCHHYTSLVQGPGITGRQELTWAHLGPIGSTASLTQGQGAPEVSERWASVGWPPDIPEQGPGLGNPYSSIHVYLLLVDHHVPSLAQWPPLGA